MLAKVRCPALSTLVIHFHLWHEHEKVTEHGLTRFLSAMPSLSKLTMLPNRHQPSGFHLLWSYKILMSLLRIQSLIELKIPTIPDGWIQDLISSSQITLFSTLWKLSTSLSDPGLERLLPYIKNVAVLKLHSLERSSRMLAMIAVSFPGLRSLRLNFRSGMVIRGADLSLLAENCNGLECLELPSGGMYRGIEIPSADGITDTTITRVARHLPKLERLRLSLRGAALTEVSLLSLGAHCKCLARCYLFADVSYDEFFLHSIPNMFPSLALLHLDVPASHHAQEIDSGKMVRQFSRIAPRMHERDILWIADRDSFERNRYWY